MDGISNHWILKNPNSIMKTYWLKHYQDPRLCKFAAPDQTTAKFLQAKSTTSAILAQAKTKKEYKKLTAEMLRSLDSESEDEKSSASSIKTVDLADDT
ncbi:hypothetical protein Godav_021307, partial [Gossypium davidsonii]|nr:hypothetical protein [Gossypium davidsonii]MBA0644239.1 hypothetical protein [Gossypium klotzschianum]